MIARTLLALLLAACAGGEAFAASAGTSSGAVLKLPAGARAVSLGEAYAAGSPDDPASLYYNPASAVGSQLAAFSFTHSVWFQSVTYDAAALSLPLDDNGKAGYLLAGVQYLNYGGMDSLDNTGALDGSFTPHDLTVNAGWARSITKELSGGILFKYINSAINNTASTFSFDLGARYALGRGFSAGLSAQNICGSLQYAAQSAPLPRQRRLGVKWENRIFTAETDALLNSDGKDAFALGFEARPLSFGGTGVALRAGYTSRLSDARQDSAFPFSLGAGVISKMAALDYAFVPYGDLGATHHISLTLRWGPGQSPLDVLTGTVEDPQESARQRSRINLPRTQQPRQPEQQKPRPSPAMGIADITTWK